MSVYDTLQEVAGRIDETEMKTIYDREKIKML